MPHKHEWQSRIKSVEREYVAMRQAADRFTQMALDDPNILRTTSNILPTRLEHFDIAEASRNLEATYVIRLFAEFESGARQFWHTLKSSTPRAADLIGGLCARRRIPDTHRLNANSVREYRNALVHEREEVLQPLPIATARNYLCHFFSFLPEEW